MKPSDPFDAIAPIDYRYYDDDLKPFLSDKAYLAYKLKVEVALLKALALRKQCHESVVSEVVDAIQKITPEEVAAEEERVKHDIRAMVNVIRSKVSDNAKPFVHMTATSYDIIDTANAARFKDAVLRVLIPTLKDLERVLIDLTIKEAQTMQVGRTHGQHAVPITVGFAFAGYVSRLGQSIVALEELAKELKGKFSGAVGAYNASSLFFREPEVFEQDVLRDLNLEASEHSTQVVQHEPMARLMAEATITAGIMANLADDMRNLQRTEIGEVGESFEASQVGSSTMPQKRNPINFENVKSLWKIIVPRIVTVFMDQISEHQRDLTNSASQRTYAETIGYVVSMAKRLSKTMGKISVDRKRVEENIMMQKGMILAEPLYLLLAALGHPDAHEKVRTLTLIAQKDGKPLQDLVNNDEEMSTYIAKMDPEMKKIIENPMRYVGISEKKAVTIAESWRKTLNL